MFRSESIHPIENNSITGHQWPQQGYTHQHVGRSPYSTAINSGIEKWRVPGKDWCDGSPVIDKDGIIYFGSDFYLYAINPNGTEKWKFRSHEDSFGDSFGSHPAIAENGTIYIASYYGSTVYAVNPNGTEQWHAGTYQIETSVTLDDNGILYYGHRYGVDARYPNGTLKWIFHTEPANSYVASTPAIDDNGIIYFGSHDTYIYAVYPNGTMKWRYMTGNWVHGSPSIGSDGTIYCGSDDCYLYALYPNGTLKWRTQTGSQRSSPAQDKNGNLYFGVWENKIYSVAPNGTIRWVFPIGERSGVWGSTVTISDDGTIYVGACLEIGMLGGGEIIALDLNGTLQWRKTICDSTLCSSPVIAADGTVYICASNDGSPEAWGYLHAFGPVENNQPPEAPTIDGPPQGKVGKSTKFIFQANDSDNTPISFYIDWGDNTTRRTVDYEPGIPIPLYHIWVKKGTYTIRAKAIDTFGLESDWATLPIKMPISNNAMYSLWLQFLERFFERHPHAFPLLRLFLGQ